ncbi:MAG: hemerythrin domain-containing protein [Ilumatobacteraceae bacterium]
MELRFPATIAGKPSKLVAPASAPASVYVDLVHVLHVDPGGCHPDGCLTVGVGFVDQLWGTGASMDAITLLRNDHRAVEKLFKQFEKAGDEAYTTKRNIVERIIEELSVHAAIEEQMFYPAVRATVPDVEDITLEGLEEHHIVKWVLSELSAMEPTDESYDAKVTVLIENVRHHVREEESEMFPKVRDELGRKALSELGEALAVARSTAPTHPHPRLPDGPPANAVIGSVAGVVDRVSDNISGIAQGTVSATQDLFARLLGMKKPTAKPTGTSAARKRASGIRAGSNEATDAVTSTAKRAASGASTTARTAASSARTVATTAKRSAKATAASTKKSATATVGAAKKAVKTTGSAAKESARGTASTAKRGAKKTAAAARSGRSS